MQRVPDTVIRKTVFLIAAILLMVERFLARFLKVYRDKVNLPGEMYVQDRIPEYREMWESLAKNIGAKFRELGHEVWEIELNGRKTRISNDKLELDNPVTLELAGMKPLTHRILERYGLRVPDHIVFRLNDLNKAYNFLEKYPKGCVVKPAKGTSSARGVTTHIRTRRNVRKAAILASLYCQDLLMEPLIAGECYRILVFRGKMIHAVARLGPRLRGDGRSSVFQLIQTDNERQKRENKPVLQIDRDCLFTLNYQNLSLDSIPPAGTNFVVKSINDPDGRVAEVRTIYNAPVTNLIGDSLRRDVEQVARIMGSDFLGVDIITVNPAIPLSMCGGVINEVNTTPSLHHHYNPKIEKFPLPAVHILYSILGAKFEAKHGRAAGSDMGATW